MLSLFYSQLNNGVTLSPGFKADLEAFYPKASVQDKARCLELLTSLDIGQAIKEQSKAIPQDQLVSQAPGTSSIPRPPPRPKSAMANCKCIVKGPLHLVVQVLHYHHTTIISPKKSAANAHTTKCKRLLTIISVGAVLPSHHYHFYTKKSVANACTTNCKRPLRDPFTFPKLSF